MSKISGLTAAGTLHSDDLLVDVDVHDTSMASTGTDKKLAVSQLMTGMTNLGMPGNPLNPAGFSETWAGIPNGQFPSAQNWALACGAPVDDPTNGAQWYQDDVQNCYVNTTAGPGSTPALVMAVTVNGGGTTTTQARGNYVAPRLSTFIDRCGTNNGVQGAKPWSIARAGFTGFQATYGTLTVVAKMNTALGFWPAIWMLGIGHWPSCGEIDLFENFGGGTGTLALGYGNVIGPANPNDYNGYDWQTGALPTKTPANINDGAFHTYSMSLNSTYDTITMKMDGTAYANTPITKTAWLAQASGAGHSAAIWPFSASQPLGIILNVCVGDTVTPPATGYPSSGQTFPFVAMTVSSVTFTIP
jgi:hypothetical protein